MTSNSGNNNEYSRQMSGAPPHGLMFTVFLTLIANILITGSIYRYHNAELIKNATRHTLVYQELQRKAQVLEEEIRLLEGVATWEETRFYMARQE